MVHATLWDLVNENNKIILLLLLLNTITNKYCKFTDKIITNCSDIVVDTII